MKKVFVGIGILLCGVQLMAGGNINPHLSEVADISTNVCKSDKVYAEQDVHLMWQDQSYADAEDGAYKRNHSIKKSGSWKHAVNYCRRLTYGGYSDWRLPTSDELVNVHRKAGQVFTYFRSNDFWSSTSTTDKRYYVVFPADAHQYKRYKKESNYIRCVRCMGKEAPKKQYLLGSNTAFAMR